MCRFRFGVLSLAFASSLVLCAGCGKKSPNPPADDAKAKVESGSDSSEAIKKAAAELKNKSPARRANAIRSMLQIDSDDIYTALADALADPGITEGASYPGEPYSTREAAVLALLKLGAEGEKVLDASGLKTLINGLSDTSPGVREHTALAIGLLGAKAKPATDALLKLCSDKTSTVREAAYAALRKIPDVPAMSIITLMKNADVGVAFDAAKALVWLQPLPKTAIQTFIDVLKFTADPKDPIERAVIRREVADSLAQFGQDAEPAVPALMGVLKSITEEEFDRLLLPTVGRDPNAPRVEESTTMMALRKIGKPAVAPLMEALQSDSGFVRWQAATVLGSMGPDAKDSLPALNAAFNKEFERKDGQLIVVNAAGLAQVQLGAEPKEIVAKVAGILKMDDPRLRFETAKVLARFGRKAEGAVPALIVLLDDPQEAIRQQAAITLRAIGTGGKAAAPALIKKLSDENVDVRRFAVRALKALGPVAADATPSLAKLLADPDEGFRQEVMEALAAIGPNAKLAVADLAKLLKSTNDSDRKKALETLTAIGPESKSVENDVVSLLAVRDSALRLAAMNALGQIGSASPETVSALAERLKREDFLAQRLAAVRALAQLGPSAKAAGGALKEFGKSSDPRMAIWAAAALFRLGIDEAANLQVVVAALKDKTPAGRQVHLAAVDAADLLGPNATEVVPLLTEALKDKTPLSKSDTTTVRQRAASALGRMGPAAKNAVPQLTMILKDSDVNLKNTALEALGQIGPDAEFASARLREIVRSEPEFAEKAQETLDRIEKK